MADPRLHLYVLCPTASSAKAWDGLVGYYPDLEVERVVTVSPIETIRKLAASARSPFVVCRDTTWLGLGLPLHVERLTVELNARFPNWALCSNRGVSWDGQSVYDYSL